MTIELNEDQYNILILILGYAFMTAHEEDKDVKLYIIRILEAIHNQHA